MNIYYDMLDDLSDEEYDNPVCGACGYAPF